MTGRASISPTKLSLRHLRAEGYTAAVVEVWNSHVGIRQDLFGFVDVLAVRAGETVAVQTTSLANVSARVRKIRESEHFPVLVAAGWRVVVHGWDQDRKGAPYRLAREVEVTAP